MSESAPPAAPRTLVALHGNFASAAWWDALRAAPPAGWQVIAPDLPGFAGTPAPAEVSIPAYATWLRGWLAEQGVTRPALLGHSLGGAVALEYAARFPGEVAGLILAASAPLSGLVTPPENYPVLEMMPGNPALLEMSLGALFPSGRPENFAQLVTDGGRMDAGHYSGNARALERWSVEPGALARVPTLVLGGELDALVTPDMVRAQASALGVEARLFAGRGHGFPQETPQEFLAAMQEFLTTLETP